MTDKTSSEHPVRLVAPWYVINVLNKVVFDSPYNTCYCFACEERWRWYKDVLNMTMRLESSGAHGRYEDEIKCARIYSILQIPDVNNLRNVARQNFSVCKLRGRKVNVGENKLVIMEGRGGRRGIKKLQVVELWKLSRYCFSHGKANKTLTKLK